MSARRIVDLALGVLVLGQLEVEHRRRQHLDDDLAPRLAGQAPESLEMFRKLRG